MSGLRGQVALAVALIAALVGVVVTFGTLVVAGMAFSQLMVERGETLAAAQAMFRESVAGFFVFALTLAVAGSIALAMLVGQRVAAPLRDMSDAARLVAQGDRGIRVRESGPDEVRSLARSFNTMSAEIEEQDRMRREFVSNAAHELRTPLTNLQGYLEALRDGVLPAETSTFISLHEEVDRLVRLSRSLDALAEGEAERGAFAEVRDIDLRAAIMSALDLHSVAFAKRGLRLDVELPPAIGARVDPDGLAQVLANLLQNAIRYTPAGGHVAIAARQREDDVLVSVSNTGPQISPDDLPHLFERFYRVDRSRDRSTGGAGIGLAIVKAIVELAGGHVGVDSSAGVTRFWFSMPRSM